MKTKNIPLLVLLTLLIIGCSNEPVFTFNFADEILQQGVIKRLDEKQIWYKRESEFTITIYEKDKSKVEQLGAEVGASILPLDRSISVNVNMQSSILQKLNSAGVKYRIITFGERMLPNNAKELGISAEYIIFDEEYKEKGMNIVNTALYSD